MICLLFATKFELGDFAENREWQDIAKLEGFYLNEDICVLITGAGSAKCALALAKLESLRLAQKKLSIVNIGIAGALDSRPLLSVHQLGRFIYSGGKNQTEVVDGIVRNAYPELELEPGLAQAVTVPIPLWEDDYSAELAQEGRHLVDMESYFFAMYAKTQTGAACKKANSEPAY